MGLAGRVVPRIDSVFGHKNYRGVAVRGRCSRPARAAGVGVDGSVGTGPHRLSPSGFFAVFFSGAIFAVSRFSCRFAGDGKVAPRIAVPLAAESLDISRGRIKDEQFAAEWIGIGIEGTGCSVRAIAQKRRQAKSRGLRLGRQSSRRLRSRTGGCFESGGLRGIARKRDRVGTAPGNDIPITSKLSAAIRNSRRLPVHFSFASALAIEPGLAKSSGQ